MEVGEVAEALGMTKGAVRKAIARGTMKASVVQGGPRGGGPLGGYYVVERDEVERYRTQHMGRILGMRPGLVQPKRKGG